MKHPLFMILYGLWSNLSNLWSKFDCKLDRGFLIQYLRPNIHYLQFKLGLKFGHNMDSVHFLIELHIKYIHMTSYGLCEICGPIFWWISIKRSLSMSSLLTSKQ